MDFDGGTYRYTGETTATDKAAQIKRESTFEVENSAATVTMNGSFEGDGNIVFDGKVKYLLPQVSSLATRERRFFVEELSISRLLRSQSGYRFFFQADYGRRRTEDEW